MINQSGTTKSPLGFQGKYFDQESGLNYFYHRYYNPAIGRFISEDPIGLGGGINYYKFVWNNPVKSNDLYGFDIVDIIKNEYEENVWKPLEDVRNELKRIFRENRTDIIESHKYCPKWGECFKNCFHAAVRADVELTLIAIEWFYLKAPGWWFFHRGIWITASQTMLMTGEMIIYGGAISHLGIAAYCSAKCTLNPRSF